MSDLDGGNHALLETYDRGNDKTMPDKSVALGLRARANLLMENWSAAAAVAAARQSYGLLSKDGANKPGFNKANDPNWMWALIIGRTRPTVLWPPGLPGYFPHGVRIYFRRGCLENYKCIVIQQDTCKCEKKLVGG